jgi:hypothetical protein
VRPSTPKRGPCPSSICAEEKVRKVAVDEYYEHSRCSVGLTSKEANTDLPVPNQRLIFLPVLSAVDSHHHSGKGTETLL